MELSKGLAEILCILAWATLAFSASWNLYKIRLYIESDGGDDDEGGDGPGSEDPTSPFNIDYDDPADWWKHPTKDKQPK